MATRRSRWLFVSLSLVLILYIRDLLGQTGGKVGEANIGVKAENPSILSFLESQLDSFTSSIAPLSLDNNGEPIDAHLPSPVVASEPLTFDPPSLNFEQQSVGMPQLFTVKVINPSRTQNLHLNSISGESHVFHPSFFKSKVVKAGENEWTTFDVVFLPRSAGPVRDTLYIHTSHGTFDFKVQGVGVPNPFRMRPLLGAKIPLNATYSPLITMYNPFETTLQITEMYSSGGDLHLELLSGQLQGSKTLWEIRPYETKPIARANFFGRAAVNHTSFIRVKTNLGESPSIVLPVEVEVSGGSGLYLSRELLDFGILKTGETKSLPLFVLNSSPHTVHIKSISVVPENPSIAVEPTVTFLKPGLKYLKIASVTLTLGQDSEKEQQSGLLEIVAEDDHGTEYRLQVPYDSTILQGKLAFERSQTMFRVGKPPFEPLIRNISLANFFNVPLVLYDIRLSSKAQEHFKVLDFHGPFTLPPTSEWHRPFALQFQPTSSECLYNTTLRLSTNASLFNIPFYCYDGRVTYVLNSTENPDSEDVLDYGVLAESDSVTKHFFLINPNPIRITIVSFLVSDSIPFTSVELLHIMPANMSVEGADDRVQVIMKKQGAKGPFYVEPDMVAEFRVNVTAPKKLGTFTGELQIHTSFDRVLRVPVYYKTAVGSVRIVPERNLFPPTFPYGIQKLPLLARSYYPQTLNIREVTVDPADQRFYFITERTETIPHLKPQALTELGTLVFDPLRAERESIYLGTGDSWYAPLHSGKLDAKFDRKAFSRLWDTWTSLVDDGLTQFNVSYLIHTEIDTTVPVPVEASLTWPSLSPHREFRFPDTTIGNFSTRTLNLTNPSRHPVFIQPVLLHYYPQPQRIIQHLFETGLIENLNFSLSESSFSFDPDSWGVDESLGRHTLAPVSGTAGREEAGGELKLKLKFYAQQSGVGSSVLILRNNLTGLECVLLQGRGLEGRFSVNSVQPDSERSILIQFTEPALEACSGGKTLTKPIRLSTTLRMHNSGPGSMRIRRIGIGHGGMYDWNLFRIGDHSREIVIHANKTKKLELSFSPDFTVSRIDTTLTLRTSEGAIMTFPVIVTIPHHLLASCYAVRPHSEWEQRLSYLILPVWLAILFFVTMLALIRTNFGIISPKTDTSLPTVQPTGGTLFDFGDLMKVLHNTLLEKIDTIKKGVELDEKEQTVRRSHERSSHTHHKHHRDRSHHTSTSPPHHQVHQAPPSSSLSSQLTTHTSRTIPHEAPSVELRRRSASQQLNSSRAEVSGRTSDGHTGGGLITKDLKRSEAALSSSTISPSSGSTRKTDRNRHSSEPAKKPTEQLGKSDLPHSHAHVPSSPGSKLSDNTTASASSSQHKQERVQSVGVAKPESQHVPPPAMTTDQETGMRKFVDQLSHLNEPPIPPLLASSHDSSSAGKAKKPAKLSVTSSEGSGSLPSTPTEGRSSSSSSASSSTAPTPVPPRRGKGVKKSNNSAAKSQKSASVAQTPSKSVNSSTTVVSSETASSVRAAVPEVSVEDHLERKGSDGSLQSTDSDSTTSSNSEKLEKEETSAATNGKPDVEADPPLAKDQGTGQTIPLILAQEEFLLAKAKSLSADTDPPQTAPTEGRQRERDAEKDGVSAVENVAQREREEPEKKEKAPLLPTPRNGRNKKKLRQQQKKEDKLRRKERERERHREREEEERKRESVTSLEACEELEKLPPLLSLSQSVDETDVPVTSPTEPSRSKKTVAVSPKKNVKRSDSKSSLKPIKMPGRSKTAPVQVTVMTTQPTCSSETPSPFLASSPSPPAQLQTQNPPSPPVTTESSSKDESVFVDDSPELDQPTHTWRERETNYSKPNPEILSSAHKRAPERSPSQDTEESSGSGNGVTDCSDALSLLPSSSHPVEAIPISALRAMRTKGAANKQTKLEEEEVTTVTVSHQHYAGKKSGGSRKARDLDKLPPRMARLNEKSNTSAAPTHTEHKPPEPPQKKKSIPKLVTEDIANEVETPSPEPTHSDVSTKSKSSHILPTSPHEIAATLLSKNPALKKRKGKSKSSVRRRGEEEGVEDIPDGSDDGDEIKYDKLHPLDEEEEEDDEEEEEEEDKLLWGSEDGSPRKMKHMHHYKAAPTTLSLDAEPFYPSSEFPRGKHHRGGTHHHHHHHVDTPYAAHGRQLTRSPSSFVSPEEIGSSFERKYRVREISPPQHLSLRAQHLRHHGHTLTPSPPPYSSLPHHSDVPSMYYQGRHAGIDSAELTARHHLRGAPHEITSYEISPEEYYSTTPHQQRRVTALVSEAVPSQRSSRLPRSTLYDEQIYPGPSHHHTGHRHQHHTAAAYEAAAAQRRERAHMMSRASPNPLWEQPGAYPYTASEEEAAILHLQRQRLLRKYQEEQQAKLLAARRPLDALSPVGHTSRPSRSTLYPANPESTLPQTSNLWDPGYIDTDAYAVQQSDDAFVSDIQHLRHHQQRIQHQQQHLLHEHLPQPPSRQRRRRYSSDNELGGELIPDLLQTPSSPSHMSASSLNKAPGTGYSGMLQARRVGGREHELWPDSPEKQRDPESALTTIWSHHNPQFPSPSPSSSQQHLLASEIGSSRNPFPTDPHLRGGHVSTAGAATGRENQLSFLENTYDLFKDKSIWGSNVETPSASILPWSQLQGNDLPPTD